MAKQIRYMLKDKNLFTTPRVMKRFIYTGYVILAVFLICLIILVSYEVTFVERL